MARKKYSFYIDDTQSDALKAIKERDGVLESEQVRRAFDDWIAKKAIRANGSRQASTRRMTRSGWSAGTRSSGET